MGTAQQSKPKFAMSIASVLLVHNCRAAGKNRESFGKYLKDRLYLGFQQIIFRLHQNVSANI